MISPFPRLIPPRRLDKLDSRVFFDASPHSLWGEGAPLTSLESFRAKVRQLDLDHPIERGEETFVGC